MVGRDGRLRTSFAPAPRAYSNPMEDYNETVGFLAPSHRYGGLWFSKLNEYALHLFVDERPRRVLVRDGDWFEPWEGPASGSPGLTAPKRTSISDIAERPDGLVTVIAIVADANWEQNRPALARGRTGGEISSDALPLRLMFDSVVEIIDPETGQIVGTVRSDDQLRVPGGGDGTVLYALRQDDIGRYRILVYKVVFALDQPAR